MEMLNDFIQTVGLDKSFFFQLALAVFLYFISKKLFLEDYLENFKKTESLTKGRMNRTQDLDEKIEKQKNLYEEKAKALHKEFQKIFGEIKKKAQKKHQEKLLNVQKEHKDFLKNQKALLQQSLEEQETQLKKEQAFLAELLVQKIKS